MRKITVSKKLESFINEPSKFVGKDVDFKGVVYRIKDLGNFSFVHVFTTNGILQCVLGESEVGVKEGCAVKINGLVKEAKIKDKFIFPRNIEVEVKEIVILSSPESTMPFDITKKNLNINNDVKFDLRMISMRFPMERAIFKIQEGLVQGLRNYFMSESCTEIRTPKIVKEGAEGGANIFEIEYFGERAYLTQSPQFYKEFCTGVFQKVFEIAPVFRAEKHNTNRHINEYTSVDIEIGNIESFYEIMEFELGAIQSAFKNLIKNYQYELELLDIKISEVGEIPVLKFNEVKEILKSKFKLQDIDKSDLSPVEESKICEYIKNKTGSDFVFVTHYPSEKRPFYAKDDPVNPVETLSFDLLYKGIEITTGGQRINEYQELVEKMHSRGMKPEDFEFFSVAHKYGLLPHGGFGMGLERLTQKVIGLDSVKLATMFPRDIHRLTP
ncbi:MAG: aspartate--tRNA(Asn) ligase [Bacteriovoracaceae bacterium]|jgi:nondiscriminating aspartyl-tRNA synthetase|nr:aspartate--tRNA(Asn) ligase [Bacteriovoracaceae bacterium]